MTSPTDAEQSAASPAEPAAIVSSDTSPQLAAATSTDTPVEVSTDERPSDRIQIGSQREDASAPPIVAKSMNPSNAPKADPGKSSYPPPNIRSALPPELEKELADALGGESLDSIIEGTTAAPTGAELAPETRVTGTVVNIHRDDIFVDLGGGRNQGIIPLKQFEKTAPPEVGSQLEVVVARLNPEQGLYELSLTNAAVDIGNWDEVHEGQLVDVNITGANKGGLECQISGIRGFIPMGQISIYRVENPEEFVGQRLTCVITEANRSRKNLVLSHRALMERERKEQKQKLMEQLAPGDLREGTVRSLQDFGAFVDLGGVDGMIHVSQLSWDRVTHPKEVLTVGQAVKVKIEKINKETGKISLGYRELAANPWDAAAQKFPVGARVKGTVSKLMQFGAFVRLDAGVEGLIHISEMGHGRVQRCSDVVSEGQEVEVKVVSFDRDAQRIGLSLKALMPAPERPKQEPREPEHPPVESIRRRERETDKNLKGGISGPSGGEKFGLKW